MTGKPHFHADEAGVMQRCYHRCRSGVLGFAIATVLWFMAFPVEHLLWTKVNPFPQVAQFLGIEIEPHEEGR